MADQKPMFKRTTTPLSERIGQDPQQNKSDVDESRSRPDFPPTPVPGNKNPGEGLKKGPR